jgi:hypothetical protein
MLIAKAGNLYMKDFQTISLCPRGFYLKYRENRMLKKSFMVLCLINLMACSGGGSSSAPANSSSFPDVAGRYSFNTDTLDFSCSDGAVGTNPAIALNFDVTQSANVITLKNTNAGSGIPGVTVIDSTGLTGNVQTNSSFIITEIATANIDGISGTVNLNYNQTGSFSSNGWSGTYTYTASSATIGSCTFTTSFTGSKISTSTAKISSILINENNDLPVNIYDQFSIIGSSLATGK